MDRLAAAPPRTAQPIRVVTAASLFDGHDAAINVMRRILQDSGAEVIHLGHNRSALEIVECAIQEDAHAIAISSYQGGHMEFFTYVHDLLRERSADIRVFGGGGGTILPTEVEELHRRGIDRIFSPDDGRAMGLQGMIDEVLEGARRSVRSSLDDPEGDVRALGRADVGAVARLISAAENGYPGAAEAMEMVAEMATARRVPVLGVTGTGGSGKSSLVDELVRRYLSGTSDGRVAIVSVDPSKRRTGGRAAGRPHPGQCRRQPAGLHALAGHPRLDPRPVAARAPRGGHLQGRRVRPGDHRDARDRSVRRRSGRALRCVAVRDDGRVRRRQPAREDRHAGLRGRGRHQQVRPPGGAGRARDVRKQYRRNHRMWTAPDAALPVYGTVASRFNDAGVNRLYLALLDQLRRKTGAPLATEHDPVDDDRAEHTPIPPERTRYLAEIVEAGRDYDRRADEQAALARQLYQLHGAIRLLREGGDCRQRPPARQR